MTRTVEFVKDDTVLLSMHDVTPAFEDDVLSSYDRLIDLGINSFTLLVTPMFEMKKSNTLERNPIFSQYISSLNLEVSLHGYGHLSKSGRTDEFSSLEQERAISRMRAGISMVRNSIGQIPYGFVPPGWKVPPRISKAVEGMGLHYCVSGNEIHCFKEQKILKTADLVVSHGEPSASFVNAMLEIELGGPIQIAVHPKDHRFAPVFKLIEDMKDRLGYKFTGYRDYIHFIR
jgi:predicted deacetylase